MLISSALRARSLLVAIAILTTAVLQAAPSASEKWKNVTSVDGSKATARHEAGSAVANGRLYLFGGRGNRPVERYDPATGKWQNLGAAPLEMHHMQPVAIGNLIYIVGAFTCCYPAEPTIADIHVFDTTTNSWSTAGQMPAARQRGSTGAVVRNGKIYLVGGNTKGHSGGAVPWFDEYDPATGNWKTLPDAPNARDHFQVAIVGNRLVAAAGRRTTLPNPFDNPVSATDIYNFTSGKWTSGQAVPTVRAGTAAVGSGGEVLIAGGEIHTQSDAYAMVEAYNPETNNWRTLQPMNTGRHSGGGSLIGNTWHMVAGSRRAGGGPETSTHETLDLAPASNDDRDGDGLSNSDETTIHGTDPDKADTDGDRLSDAEEVSLDTNPLVRDTDGEGLDDGAEVNTHDTDPKRADTDGDNATDAQEINELRSNPLVRDTDADGLIDGSERMLGTSAIRQDSDDDSLSDGDEVNVHGTSPLLADTDDDGLRDDDELRRSTDPLRADTDGDGRDDGAEVEAGTDPLVAEGLATGSGTSGGEGTDGSTEGEVTGNEDGGGQSGTGGDGNAGDSTDSGTGDGDTGDTGGGNGSGGGGGISTVGSIDSDAGGASDTGTSGGGTGADGSEDGAGDTEADESPSRSSGGGAAGLLLLALLGWLLPRRLRQINSVVRWQH